MQWNRNDDVELTSAQPFVLQSSTELTRYKLSQVHLASVFKFVNDLSNNTASAVCSDGCVEVDRAVGAVSAGKHASDSAVEGFRAFLAKWRDDTYGFCFALIAKMLASSNASPADCASRRVQKRYGRLQQFKLLPRDHFSARSA
jgi:hypothetical protein